MAGFIRRFGFFPGTEVITEIEGVVIVDLPPPGAVEGIATGVVGVVGEFADMTSATQFGSSGDISTNIVPQEIFSSQDLLDKVGGFDQTIGDFGDAQGNGYVSLRNKRYSRLICAPVNLCSAQGSRFFRDLPLATSQTDPNSVVPVQGGTISAGREFRIGAARFHIGRRVEFTSQAPLLQDTGGTVIAGASATTQTFLAGQQILQAWQIDDPDGSPVFVDMTTEINNPTVNDVIPFPATEAVDDAFAIGASSPFGRIVFNTTGGTQGVGGAVDWEYWDGSAWTALSNVVDGTSGFTAALGDDQAVTFDVPADWATLALNSVTAYYVRAQITTVYTSNPQLSQGFDARTVWSEVDRGDGNFGVALGDIIVLGYNNAGTVAPVAEAGTYRVQTTPSSGSVSLTVERLDGAAFVWTEQLNIPYRIHISTDADSAPERVIGSSSPGGYAAATVGGYTVPLRPLTDATGAQADGTHTAGQLMTPQVVPTPITGASADPLSGLTGRLQVTTATAFNVELQGLNRPNSSDLDAAYATAIDAMLSEDDPVRDINIMLASRKSSNIRTVLNTHVQQASEVGLGRVAVISPELQILNLTDVLSSTDPGVGARRSERLIYSWPGAVTFVPEAVNILTGTADGDFTTDGNLDDSFDFWLASILSNLPPERNPGQAAQPVPAILSPVAGFQRGVSGLGITQYTALRRQGVAALRLDRTVGPIVQSGVTTSQVSGQTNINRRRMADFIEDSLAQRLVQFSKLPLTTNLRDGAVGEVDQFLDDLLSPDNPAAQRINAYQVDDKSGNTPSLEAQGIFVIIVRVRLTPTADFIVVQAEIGEGVVITQTLAA